MLPKWKDSLISFFTSLRIDHLWVFNILFCIKMYFLCFIANKMPVIEIIKPCLFHFSWILLFKLKLYVVTSFLRITNFFWHKMTKVCSRIIDVIICGSFLCSVTYEVSLNWTFTLLTKFFLVFLHEKLRKHQKVYQ